MSILLENEPDTSNTHDMPIGLYYYYININKLKEANYLGWVSTIESITYNPFLEEEDLLLYKGDFNVEKFGKPTGDIPKCYRIGGNTLIEKTLKEITLFPTKDSIGNLDEIKLYMFPYRYYIITDYFNSPLLIKPQLVDVHSLDNKLVIKVTTVPLSQTSKYNLFVEGYKNDIYGNLEGIVNNNALMLPVASSAYSQFLATSSASFNQGNINAMLENDITLKQGLQNNAYDLYKLKINTGINTSVNAFTGNIFGSIATGLNAGMGFVGNTIREQQLQESYALKENAISSMASARVTDMLTTPRAIKTTGNDSVFNIWNARKQISLIEYEVSPQQKERLREYFIRFGYKQNRYMDIKLNARKYHTFIKTTICNIKGEKIPHADLNEIKNIFNSGITFWNMENNPTIGSYFLDNKEVE